MGPVLDRCWWVGSDNEGYEGPCHPNLRLHSSHAPPSHLATRAQCRARLLRCDDNEVFRLAPSFDLLQLLPSPPLVPSSTYRQVQEYNLHLLNHRKMLEFCYQHAAGMLLGGFLLGPAPRSRSTTAPGASLSALHALIDCPNLV